MAFQRFTERKTDETRDFLQCLKNLPSANALGHCLDKKSHAIGVESEIGSLQDVLINIYFSEEIDRSIYFFIILTQLLIDLLQTVLKSLLIDLEIDLCIESFFELPNEVLCIDLSLRLPLCPEPLTHNGIIFLLEPLFILMFSEEYFILFVFPILAIQLIQFLSLFSIYIGGLVLHECPITN